MQLEAVRPEVQNHPNSNKKQHFKEQKPTYLSSAQRLKSIVIPAGGKGQACARAGICRIVGREPYFL